MTPALRLASGASVALLLAAAAPALAQPASPPPAPTINPITGARVTTHNRPVQPQPDIFLAEVRAGTLSQEDYNTLRDMALAEVRANVPRYVERGRQLGFQAGQQGGEVIDSLNTLASQGGAGGASISDVLSAGLGMADPTAVVGLGATYMMEEVAGDMVTIARHMVEARARMPGANPQVIQQQLRQLDHAGRTIDAALYQQTVAINQMRTTASNMTPAQIDAAAAAIQRNIDAGIIIRNTDGSFTPGPNAPPEYRPPPPLPTTPGPSGGGGSGQGPPTTSGPPTSTGPSGPPRRGTIPGQTDPSIYVNRQGPAPPDPPTPVRPPTTRTPPPTSTTATRGAGAGASAGGSPPPPPRQAPPPVILIRRTDADGMPVFVPGYGGPPGAPPPVQLDIRPPYHGFIGDPEFIAALGAGPEEGWGPNGWISNANLGDQLGAGDAAGAAIRFGSGGDRRLPPGVVDGHWQAGDAFAAALRAGIAAGDVMAWQAFEDGNWVIVAHLEPIYEGYDITNMAPGSSGRSLTAAGSGPSSLGNSLSSAGWSLSAVGWSLSSAGWSLSSLGHSPLMDWDGIALASRLFNIEGHAGLTDLWLTTPASLGEDAWMGRPFGMPNPWAYQPWADVAPDLVRGLYGPLWSDRRYEIQRVRPGFNSFTPGGEELGGLTDGVAAIDTIDLLFGGFDFGFSDSLGWLLEQHGLSEYVRTSLTNGQGGLSQILAQPFNVVLTWGAGAFDLDLHMTGPTGGLAPNAGPNDRWHIYYAARGSQAQFPFAELIRDCICSAGSEVVQTSQLLPGGVYRVSVFNFGDQSAGSTNLSGQSQATIQVVRGGTVVEQGQGTTIAGGRTIVTRTVPQAGAGNTWVAVEIDPSNGRIRAPDQIVQTEGSGNVQ